LAGLGALGGKTAAKNITLEERLARAKKAAKAATEKADRMAAWPRGDKNRRPGHSGH